MIISGINNLNPALMNIFSQSISISGLDSVKASEKDSVSIGSLSDSIRKVQKEYSDNVTEQKFERDVQKAQQVQDSEKTANSEDMAKMQAEQLAEMASFLEVNDAEMLSQITTDDLKEFITFFKSGDSELSPSKSGGITNADDFWKAKFETDEDGNFKKDKDGNYIRKENSSLVDYAVWKDSSGNSMRIQITGIETASTVQSKNLDKVNPGIMMALNDSLKSGDKKQLFFALAMAEGTDEYTPYDPQGDTYAEKAKDKVTNQLGYFIGTSDMWNIMMTGSDGESLDDFSFFSKFIASVNASAEE